MSILTLIVPFLLALVAIWLASAGVTLYTARKKGGNPSQWALLGLLLGPVGIYLTTRLDRPCPSCQAPVLRDVLICPGCGSDIPRRDPEDNPKGPLWTYRRNW